MSRRQGLSRSTMMSSLPLTLLIMTCWAAFSIGWGGEAIADEEGARLLSKDLELAAPMIHPTEDGQWVCVETADGLVEVPLGAPALPSSDLVFSLPRGYRPVSVRLEGGRWGELDLPLPVQPFAGEKRGGVEAPLSVEANPDIYQSPGLYPREPVELMATTLADQQTLIGVRVSAIRYEPLSRQLLWLESGRVILEVVPADEPAGAVKRLRPSIESDKLLKKVGGLVYASDGYAPAFMPTLEGSPVEYLIITTADQSAAWQELADWKTATGTPAAVRTIENILENYHTGADDAERLRFFLKDAYTYWGLKYLLLAGEPGRIPIRYFRTWSFNQDGGGMDILTDLYFACLDGSWNADGDRFFGEPIHPDPTDPNPEQNNTIGDGNDLNGYMDFGPDIFVGRVTTVTSAEAQGYIHKYLTYSGAPATDGYLDRVILFGEVLFDSGWRYGDHRTYDDDEACPQDGIPCATRDGAEDCEDLVNLTTYSSWQPDFLRFYERYELWGPLYDNVIATRHWQIMAELNAGANIVHHVGHGDIDRWAIGSDPASKIEQRIIVADAQGLSNGNNDHFTGLTYAINCNSAAIDFNCLAEAMVVNPNGGTIVYIGSTNLDFPNVARTFQNPFYEDLLRYETQYAGDAFYETMETRGAGMRDTDDTTRRFLLYCLTYLGDPQMQIWLGNPGTLALDFPGTVEIGDDTIDIAVTKNGNPAIGALVTLSKDGESYAYGITNVDGEISLPLMANTTGTFDVSATAYQSVAASGSGQVVTTTETVLSLGDIVIIDDGTANSRGNGNGLAELGETVVIDLSVINNGGLAASSVQADLSWDETTWESLVDLELASASLGGIAAGSEANEPAAFRIRIPRVLDSADAANLVGDDLMQMAFEIELTSLEVTRSHKWVLEASRPILKKYINLVDDAAGNDDGIADNGETINLYVGLWNQGMGTASALAGSLVAYPTSAATMIDNSADLEELLPGEAGAIGPFQLTLNNVTQLTLGLFIKDMTPADHPQVLNRRFHLIRPPAPDSLKSIGQRSSIVLIWQNPLAPRDPIIGARVYRSEQEAGPFEEVFPGMAMNTTYFRDDGLNALTAYYYKIAVIDSSGNEGALSEMLETNTSPGPLANWPQLLGTATRSSPTITELDGWALREILAGGEVVYCFHGDGSEFYDGDGIASTSGILTQRPGSEDAPIWGKVAAWDMDMAADNDPEIVALSFSGCPDGSDTGLSVLMSFNHKGEMIWHHCLGRYGVASPAIGLIDSDDEYEVVTATSSRIFAYNHDGTAMSGTNNGVLKDIVDARNLFQTPTLADIDNDGTDEVLLLAWNGNDRLQAQKLFALNGDGTDVAGFPVDLGTLGYSNLIGNTGSVVVADLDQNSEPGDLDLEIAFMTAKRFWIFEHDGSLRLVSSSDGALAFGNDGAGLQTPAIGDVDLDGHPEVVFALRTIYGMVLHALKGTATEVSAENELPGFPLIIDENNDFEPGSPIIANINDDIFPEILIGDTEGRVHVYDKDGNGVLGFPYNIPGADLRYGGLAVWDVDGNGYNNLVIQASDNRDLLVLDLTQSLFPSDPDERIRQNPWPMKYHDARNSGFYQADIMTPVFLSQLSAIEESPGKIRITFTTAVTGAEILIWRQEAAQGEWTLRHRLTAIDGELGHYDILDETEASGTFEYKIEIVDDSGTTFEAARFQVEATGSIRALTLEPNRPNPFRPGTMLSFQIPGTESTPVELWIYDSTGRVIRRLISGNLPPGTHQVQWNGRNDNDQPVAAGLYLVRLRAMGEEKQGKMLLLK